MKGTPILVLSLSCVSFLLPALLVTAGVVQAKQAESSVASQPTSQSAGIEMKKVMAEYDAGHFDQALELCKGVLRKAPTNLTAHYFMGNICVKTNRIKDAVAQYKYCLQSPGAKTSPEAAYAEKALEQIKQQNDAQPPAQSGASSRSSAPGVGSTRGAEEYIQEQTDILAKEQKEKIAVKQRILDDKVGQIQEEMRQQAYNLPRVGGRRMAAQEAKQEASQQIKDEGQKRIDQLKKDFEREVEDLNQYYQNRIAGLSDYHHNMESQSGGRSRTK